MFSVEVRDRLVRVFVPFARLRACRETLRLAGIYETRGFAHWMQSFVYILF